VNATSASVTTSIDPQNQGSLATDIHFLTVPWGNQAAIPYRP
jgi:hypothetical protein